MIIGLTGKKSSGKDTIAEYLQEQYSFGRLSFAALLKHSAAALFGIDPQEWELYKNDSTVRVMLLEGSDDPTEPELHIQSDLSAREFLQRYGTEAHRAIFGDDFWIEQMWKYVDEFGIGNIDYVFSDCRFANEALSIIDHSGVIWRVHRPEQDEGDTHVSEDLSQTDPFVTLELQNDGTLEHLYNAVDEALEVVYGFTG